MRLTFALTFPSPEVSALSANAGPNVVAVRTRRPVAGIQLERKAGRRVAEWRGRHFERRGETQRFAGRRTAAWSWSAESACRGARGLRLR